MTALVTWDFLFKTIVTGVTGGTIGFGAFEWLGKKWIENKFNQRLESLRQDHAKELAELKVRWDTQLQGQLRFQEREFEVLPAVWDKLSEATGLLSWLTSAYQEYANVGDMNSAELDQFLERSELLQTQKDEVRERTGEGRARHYQFLICFHRHHRVLKALNKYSTYVNKNLLFFPDTLLDKLKQISDASHEALSSYRLGHEHGDAKLKAKSGEIAGTKVRPLVDAAQSEIRTLIGTHRSTV